MKRRKQPKKRNPVARDMFDKQSGWGYHTDRKKEHKPKHKKKIFEE